MDDAASPAPHAVAHDAASAEAMPCDDEFTIALAVVLPLQLTRRLSGSYRALQLTTESDRMRRAALRAFARDAATSVLALRRRAATPSDTERSDGVANGALALLQHVVDELAALPAPLRASRFAERRRLTLALARTVADELVMLAAAASRPPVPPRPPTGEFDEWRSRMRSGLGTREWCLVFLFLRGEQGAGPADLEQWLPVHMHSPARKVILSLQRQRVVVRRSDGAWILTGLGFEEVRRRGLWDHAAQD